MGTRVAVPLDEYLKVQSTEVDSPLNEQGAGEEFHRPPDRNDRWLHYIHVGRAAAMQNIHSQLNLWATGERLGLDPLTLSVEQREAELQKTYRLWKEHHSLEDSA